MTDRTFALALSFLFVAAPCPSVHAALKILAKYFRLDEPEIPAEVYKSYSLIHLR